MSINNFEDLNSMHMDVLKEIGNIGSGNAATALSSILGQMIDIQVPSVSVLDHAEAVERIGGLEKIIIGILVRLDGDINGMILFLIEHEFAENVINKFFGSEVVDILNLTETDMSVLNEVGNIMAGSYVGAISSISGLFINLSVPSLTVDMLGAIMSVPAIEFAHLGDKVLYIDEGFTIDNQQVNFNMVLVPEIDSLALLLQRLGVEA